MLLRVSPSRLWTLGSDTIIFAKECVVRTGHSSGAALHSLVMGQSAGEQQCPGNGVRNRKREGRMLSSQSEVAPPCPPPQLSVPTPKEGNQPLSCFKVQRCRKDTVKEQQGILLILKAQRFQAITSMSVSREVEGISMLHLACPLLPSSSSQRTKRFGSAFPQWSCL